VTKCGDDPAPSVRMTIWHHRKQPRLDRVLSSGGHGTEGWGRMSYAVFTYGLNTQQLGLRSHLSPTTVGAFVQLTNRAHKHVGARPLQ